ncbi:Flp family type IVb pilin [Catellatospora paridis]|uniref:Flp family type IVb pilin n=1 Tax=Catellatospora paridis TaxID=1617086 RepID=UPI0012D38961|nr:Flp family type IVb pilin [Catellatospora paridis]
MRKIITKTQAAWANRDRGATAVEYALIVSLIAVVIIVAVRALGVDIDAAFDAVTAAI